MIELYNDKHVAARLYVTRPAVTNWRNRYGDTPPPYAMIAERPGINRITPPTPLWDSEGLDAWEVWHRNHFRKDTKDTKEALTGTK